MTFELRPYQLEAVGAVYQYLREHDDNPCVVIPTAGGKTPILSTICKEYPVTEVAAGVRGAVGR